MTEFPVFRTQIGHKIEVSLPKDYATLLSKLCRLSKFLKLSIEFLQPSRGCFSGNAQRK